MWAFAAQGHGDNRDYATMRAFAAHAGTAKKDHETLRAFASHSNSAQDQETLKAYLSQGDWRWPDTRRIVPSVGYPHVLISFVYDEDGDFFEDKLGYWPPNILGDSGAFTVWTRGDTVDIERYADWCLAYQEKSDGFLAITLDVIPGEVNGGAPTTRQRNKAMKQGIENSDYLRSRGVRIMEVFHWHEPIKQFDVLLERRQAGEVVGVGGLAGKGSRSEKMRFVSGVFDRLRDHSEGWTNTPKLHGLGLSPVSPLCTHHPWWSVDSSSWVSPGRFGMTVNKSGKRGARDNRVGNRDLRHVYLTRVLSQWTERERVLTETWLRRGIVYRP